jgi:calcium uniporter protein, mitochondrial
LDANYIIYFQEYLLPDVKDRQHLITLHKAAKKAGLDLAEYNDVKREIAEVEHDLRRLNDPLYKNLTAFPPKTPNFSQTEIDSAKKLKTVLADAKLLKGEKGSLAKITNILQEATKRLKK